MTAAAPLPPDLALVIFDADGTLRRTTVAGQPCPRRAGEWELLPGVRERLAALADRRLQYAVASNQDQVGYGHLTAATAHALLADLLHAATGRHPRPGAVRFCPHVLEQPCPHRKPAPGMLWAIMRVFDTTPVRTLFVGDAECDRLAAVGAGVRFMAANAFFARAFR